MNRLAAAAAAVILAAVSAFAAFDLTTGTVPDNESLSWGDKSVRIYGSGVSDFFRIATSASDRFAITSGGLVGIGTNAPLSGLDINGSLAVGSYAGVTAAPSNGLIVSGQVGIGSGSPAASSMLEVGSGTGVTQSFRVITKGLVEFHSSAAPIVSACATAPSVAAGTDQAGDVTIGKGGNQATCTLTFASGGYSNIPHCFCSNRSTNIACVAQATATTLVMVPTGSSSFASVDVLDYVCFGHN